MRLEQDGRAIVSLDSGTDVWNERARVCPALGKVGSAEATSYLTLAAALCQEEELLPTAFQFDAPTLGIDEPDPVQVHKLQRCPPLPARPEACSADRHGDQSFDLTPIATSLEEAGLSD